MNILFIHQNFPGQFRYLAPALSADPGNRVVAMHMRKGLPFEMPHVTDVRSIPDSQNTPGLVPWMMELETKYIRGEASYRTALKLRDGGFYPDIIFAHPGWGEALFTRDVWPKARLLCLFEFYYHAHGQDLDFDPEFAPDPENDHRIRLKNINNLLALESCDAGVSPTAYQRSVHPADFKSKIEVIHDGIDTDVAAPDPSVVVSLPDTNITLTRQDEVITFVSRNLEPYRGWHRFARALPGIQKRLPRAHVIVVGGDSVSYCAGMPNTDNFKNRILSEVTDDLDWSRIHILGRVPYPTLISIFQISTAHVYLTYPFVLSWSMLEAMSCGALVIGSRTAPVEEVISHGENGLLVDFFSTQELVDAVGEAVSDPERMQAVRDRARQTILERYDLKRICLPRQIELIKRLAG